MKILFSCILLAGCLALPAMAQQSAFIQRQETLFSLPAGKIDPEKNWTDYFYIDALVGFNIKDNFSMSGNFNVTPDRAARGIYDDGYVRTDNKNDAFGQTGFWGYDNSSQLSGSTLTMHSASGFSTAEKSSGKGGAFPGFEMGYKKDLWYWGRARIGFDGAIGILPIRLQDKNTLTAVVTNSVFNFDTGSILVPTAPYHGSFNRDGEPTISTNISPQSSIVDSSDTITGTRTVDAGVCMLRLGPSVMVGVSRNMAVSVGAGPVVGVVAGDYRYNEIIQTGFGQAHNHGSFGGAQLIYGGYVDASLVYHLTDDERDACIFIGARYAPMSSATFSKGGRTAHIDFSGQMFVTAGVGWPF